MSTFIKLIGTSNGSFIFQPPFKTVYIHPESIEEICDLKGNNRFRKDITKEEYEKHPDDHTYGKIGDQHFQFFPTSMVLIRRSEFQGSGNSEEFNLKMNNHASKIVAKIEQDVIDFEVRKALAVEAALNPPKKL